MKLIYCPACKDLFKLHLSKKDKQCQCGLSWGRYSNEKDARIGGFAIPIGIDNKSLLRAIAARSKPTRASHNDFMHFTVSHPFDAFVIPVICSSIKDEKQCR